MSETNRSDPAAPAVGSQVDRGVMRLALLVACVLLAVPCIADALHFHRLASGEYLTPWYPPQWWKAPYTHAALAMLEGREYWTLNAIGSERWHVREVAVGRVVFWTTLERRPVQAA